MINSLHNASDEEYFYCALIGQVVLRWSRIERSLDLAIFASRYLPMETRHHGQAPRLFKSKIEALRKVCFNNPRFTKNHKFIKATLDKAMKLAEQRHLIVHGYVNELDTGEPTSMTFRAAYYEEYGPQKKELKATVDFLLKLIGQLREMDWLMGLILFSIMTAKNAKETDN
jgi:hypothetical protein